jgi:hypothetical protein
MAPSNGPPGTYTSTGWRVVGSRAAQVVKEASPSAARRLLPGRVEDTLFAVDCTAPSMIQGRVMADRVLEAVTDEVRRSWPACPRLLRDEVHDEPPSRFGGLRVRYRRESGECWRGEMLWRSVHPMVAGAPITTRVTLEERPQWLRLGIRVTADEGPSSVHGFVGAGQAQPRFLSVLHASVPFTWLGGPLEVRRIRPGDEEDFVQSVMGSGMRSYPVVVLSPLEEGGYVVEPDDLLGELFGRARLFVFETHAQTYKLTDLMRDRRMSCYLGAARCYMPGWSPDDDPLDHPLLLSERLADPVMRAAWSGEIGRWYGQTVRLPEPVEDAGLEEAGDPAPSLDEPEHERAAPVGEALDGPSRLPPTATPIDDSATATSAATPSMELPASGANGGSETAAAPVKDIALEAVTSEIRELAALVRGLMDVQGALRDEVERLRTLAAVRASSTNAIERRLGQLEMLIEELVRDRDPVEFGISGAPVSAEESAEEDEGRLSLVDVVRTAAETHSASLLVLDSALDAAADSPYEDPERVKAILDAMARVARKRGDGTLGTSLREAFNDFGLDYRGAISSTTSARLRQQYEFLMPNGEPIETEEHIVLGNTYDPRRCLRIYFSSRVPTETRFVIGHVGRHFEVRSST